MRNRQYSKSSSHYAESNRDYFDSNASLLEEALSQNAIYAAQPRRSQCKVCQADLPDELDLSQHGVGYVFCTSCSHLNGVHDDTEEFVNKLYIGEAGDDYGAHLMDPAFADRADLVYGPKAEFLLSSIDRDDLKVLDVGCGSGHFVYSLLKRGIRSTGIDVGKSVVEFGNNQISHQLGQEPLRFVDEHSFFEEVTEADADVVSAIGVIEHLRDPSKFFEAFRKSRAEYVFYSVPMFSMSTLFENIFPTIFPRQLSGGHTHLFTEGSIVKLNALLGAEAVAEWRFGTDMMDLYRMTSTLLQANGASSRVNEHLREGFGSKVDELQAVLDRNHFCSEIHVVAAK